MTREYDIGPDELEKDAEKASCKDLGRVLPEKDGVCPRLVSSARKGGVLGAFREGLLDPRSAVRASQP